MMMMMVYNNKKTATTVLTIIIILGLSSLVVSVATMALTSQNTMSKENEKKEKDIEYC
jgi:flagellar basal body-associated protein FliL